MSQETRRNNRIPPSTPEVIDLDSFQSYGKRIISDVINLSDDDDEEEDVKILHFIPKTNPSSKRKRNINFEKGESSNSKDTPFVCEICTDTKTTREAFNISGCSHAYCSDCVATYVGSKLDDNIVKIGCPFPGCSGLLEVEFCRSILSAEVFERWGKALCEAMFNFSEKFYCPFKDCSALLINDGTEDVRNSECPNCNRMFCAQCKVPWHDGIECSEFEKLNADERGKEDVMLMNLAKDMQWRRCPKCRIYVARTMGCNFMMCRCRYTFCYQCGGEYSTTGGGCTCYKLMTQNYSGHRGRRLSSSDLTRGISTVRRGVSTVEQFPSGVLTRGVTTVGIFPPLFSGSMAGSYSFPSFPPGVSTPTNSSGNIPNRNTPYSNQSQAQMISRNFTGGESTSKSFPFNFNTYN